MIRQVISPLWKRGVRGDFYSFKSPFVPLFQGGIINIFPLWKRGARGDFILSNPTFVTLTKEKKKKTNPPLSPFF
ncbi:MAG: hypothetical protein KA120_05435 [Candidatus Goldbacteria bacterium]|nr:hypothetical protein [Candidatus Goldiibacteriota bacterium]